MGLAELKALWDAGGPWTETFDDWHARRNAELPELRAIVERFMGGASSPSQFRHEMDVFTRRTGYGGFQRTGQMFFNMLVKASDEGALGDALRKALPAPADEAEARIRFADFLAYVDEARERAPTVGASPPAHGFVPYFLTFFWEAEDRDTWPIYYKNSRETLAAHGLFQETGPLDERYLRLRAQVHAVREALGTDTWGVEALLWHLKQMSEPKPKPNGGPGPKRGPQPEDLYETFHTQGLIFPDEVLTSLVLSLLTKPFVLLSGISGTGKTQLAVGLAEYLDRRAGGGVVEIEPPESDDANLYIRLTAPRLRRGHAGVTQEHLAVLAEGLPERGASVSYEVTLPDGKTAPLRLANIGFADPGRQQHRLFFRGPIKEWLQETAEAGDYLKLALGDDGAISSVDVVRSKRDESETPIRRHEVIAVRSDWTDPRGLIGYENPLTGTYAKTDLITLLLRAQEDPEHPYVVILDEMNLARVEYYFSDFLSAMELAGGTIALRDASAGGLADEEDEGDSEVPRRLVLPPNVLFIGTVNIDETTHAFSPKVLDRANVIVFNEVDVQRFLEGGGEAAASTFRLADGTLDPSDFAERGGSAAVSGAKQVPGFTEPLLQVHALLAQHTLHFGYRVLGEVARFVGHAIARVGGETEDVARTAFDLQLTQKVLPKLNGGRELDLPLAELLAFCLDGAPRKTVDPATILDEARRRLANGASAPPPAEPADDDDELGEPPPDEPDVAAVPKPAAYPRSARALERMLAKLRQTGFVAFLE